MSLSIKVRLADGTTKSFKWSGDSMIIDLLNEVREKVGETTPVEEFGFFQRASKGRHARWFLPNRTLKFYGVGSGTELDFKKKAKVIKVKLMDDSLKAMIIDSSVNVRAIINAIGEKLDLKNCDEYGIRRVDSNDGEWLEDEKTLFDQGAGEDESLLFAKRYFNSDVSAGDDPRELHLIYIQSLADVLKGKYDPLQRQEAINLASFAVQVTHGNHDPNRHKPGFLDLARFLPLPWPKDKKIEADIFKEHKKLIGTTESNAKYRFVQLVRSLKTYGITFFKVLQRERDKKKPTPLMLGISKENLIAMDFETREFIKEWRLDQLRRWAAANGTFMLDFGDHESDYVVFQTPQGDQISALISGYIDLLLASRNSGGNVYNEDDAEQAEIEDATPTAGYAVGTAAMVNSPGMAGLSAGLQNVSGVGAIPFLSRTFATPEKMNVMDIRTAIAALRSLTGEMGAGLEGFNARDTLSNDEWGAKFTGYMEGAQAEIAKLLQYGRLDPSKQDTRNLDSIARNLHMQTLGMLTAAKNIASLDNNMPLLNGAKSVAEAITRLLAAMQKGNPGDIKLLAEMLHAENALKSSLMALDHSRHGRYIDRGAELLMLECIADLESALAEMVDASTSAANSLKDTDDKDKLLSETDELKVARDWMLGTINMMAPVALEETIQFELLNASAAITESSNKLLQISKDVSVNKSHRKRLDWAAARLNDAMRLLLDSRMIAEYRGAEEDIDLETPSNVLQAAISQIRKNIDTPAELILPTKNGLSATGLLIKATRALADATDDATRERLLAAARSMGDHMQQLLDAVRTYHNKPGDAEAKARILELAALLEADGQSIISEGGVTAALTALRYYAKVATAKMIRLQSAANASFSAMVNEETLNALWKLGGQLAGNIDAMIDSLKFASSEPENFVLQNDLLFASRSNIPGFHAFLVEALRSQKHIIDLNKKQNVSYASTDANEAIKKLEKACRLVGDIGGQTEIERALEEFDAVSGDLDAAEFAAKEGLLSGMPGQTRENAQELLALAARSLNQTLEHLAESSKLGGKLSAHIRESALAIGQVGAAVRAMASTISDRQTQLLIIRAAKDVLGDTLQLIGSGRVLIIDRSNAEKLRFVEQDYQNCKSSVATMMAAAKGLDARECDEAVALIRQEMEGLTTDFPTSASFRIASESLSSVSKALAAAMSQLVATVRSNPRGVGTTAKITSGTMSQLFQAVNIAASTSDKEIGEDIIKAAKVLGLAMIDMMNSSKSAAANQNDSTFADLSKSSQKVGDAIQGILAALGAVASPEIDEAIRSIVESLKGISNLEGVEGKTRTALLDEFTVAAQALGAITTRLVTAARTAGAKLGIYAKEAAATISQLVDATKSSGKVPEATSTDAIGTAAEEMLKACGYIQKNPEDAEIQAKVAAKATAIAKVLISEAKEIASRLNAAEQKEKQQRVITAMKGIANTGVDLYKQTQTSTSSEGKSQAKSLKKAVKLSKELSELTQELVSACADSGIVVNDAEEGCDAETHQNIEGATISVGKSVAFLIRSCATVAANKGNEEANAELSKNTKALTEAIAALLQVTSVLNPGIQECLRAEELLRSIDKDLISVPGNTSSLSAPANKAHADCQEDLVNACKALGDDVLALSQSAVSSNVGGMVDTAKKLQRDFNSFHKSVKDAVATSNAKESQKEYLDNAKVVIDQCLGLLTQVRAVNPNDKVSVDTLTAFANNAAHAIGAIIASLQSGAGMVRDLEKIIADMKTNFEALPKPLDAAVAKQKRYGQYREDIATFASKDLADLVTKIANTVTETVGQLGLNAKRISDQFPAFVANVRGAAASTSDAQAGQAIVQDASAFVKDLLSVLEHAKEVARDAHNQDAQSELRTASQPFFVDTAKLLATLRKGAVGEVLCDNAIAEIQKAVQQMNTAALFAQAGQLEADKAATSVTVTKLQENLMAAINSVSAGANNVNEATSLSQDDVGAAAVGFAKQITDVATASIQTASRVNESKLQQDLLSAAKMLGIRSHQLILAGKDVERAPGDSTVQSTLSSSFDSVMEALRLLSTVAQGAAASAAVGERELENARKVIMSILSNIPGQDGATPQDVIKACRDTVACVQDLVFAGTQEEMVAAAQKALLATEKLLNTAATASKLSPDPATAKALVDAVRMTAQQMMSLLDVAKLSRDDPSSQKKREDASADVTTAVNVVVAALRKIPGGENLSLEETADLENLANSELLKAAKIIEEAAAILARAKRPARPAGEKIDMEALTDAILGAAHAIAEATMGLIAAATYAQGERKEAAATPAGAKYRDDPTWANGLISAAKGVAAAVRQLVVAANAAAQGKADQAVLIASARAVAATTAQLVAACRAKADPLSKGQQKLSVAAKAVSDATARLVTAAQEAANFQEAESEVAQTSGWAQSAQAKYDQQIKIINLEAQIQAERKRLAAMNRAEYGK